MTATSNSLSLKIRSGQGDYCVAFVRSMDALLSRMLAVPKAVVVVDRQVARIYAKKFGRLLRNRPVYLAAATEEEKTPSGVTRFWEFLQRANATKGTQVVVIGGGIIQDIAQFACHNYYRGISWHFAPTTLLAQADSCIGGKCGINLGSYKNQLGVFHSPAQIWICPEFLDTLADEDLCSGYGEILKLHLTRGSSSLFHRLVSVVEAAGWRNRQIGILIRQSLQVKRGVIEEDEYEKDLRRILNYGHTFGHALEAITRHAIPHGVAVAWGIDLVNFLAWQWGRISRQHFLIVHEFICRHFAWKIRQKVTARELVEATLRDKKVQNGKLNLILPKSIGHLEIVPVAYGPRLLVGVREYLRQFNVVHWG